MKKLILICVILVVVCGRQSFAQCNSEELSSTCIPRLTTSGFNFLKTYKISGERDLTKVEYSYVFTKGTQYMISLCDQNTSQNTIMVTIYDGQRNKVASNKVGGKLLAGLIYPCNATGIYYMQYTFEESSQRCGGSALGFKK